MTVGFGVDQNGVGGALRYGIAYVQQSAADSGLLTGYGKSMPGDSGAPFIVNLKQMPNILGGSSNDFRLHQFMPVGTCDRTSCSIIESGTVGVVGLAITYDGNSSFPQNYFVDLNNRTTVKLLEEVVGKAIDKESQYAIEGHNIEGDYTQSANERSDFDSQNPITGFVQLDDTSDAAEAAWSPKSIKFLANLGAEVCNYFAVEYKGLQWYLLPAHCTLVSSPSDLSAYQSSFCADSKRSCDSSRQAINFKTISVNQDLIAIPARNIVADEVFEVLNRDALPSGQLKFLTRTSTGGLKKNQGQLVLNWASREGICSSDARENYSTIGNSFVNSECLAGNTLELPISTSAGMSGAPVIAMKDGKPAAFCMHVKNNTNYAGCIELLPILNAGMP